MEALLLLWVIGLALGAYVLTGGADFGAGVWDLLASGPRRARQREAIEQAIAPIWEANHIWLILVVVLAFTGFPIGFAAIGIALHIPIALALVGIVLRGAAFAFRGYGIDTPTAKTIWGRVFAWSSLLTPVCLGLVVGGLSSPAIRIVAPAGAAIRMESGWLAGWLSPFALLVGAFVLVLFALLAAVYLAAETAHDDELSADFRRRAIAAEIVAAVLAAATALQARVETPLLFDGLVRAPWSLPVQTFTFVAACTALVALATRRPRLARAAAIGQVSGVVVGWGLAMDGHLFLPALPISQAGAVGTVVHAALAVLGVGALVLGPALFWLMRVFKGR
ncbi:MAG TPA: cytochrome d ubiquinol oxidase subunit II [Nannocystaceae bacterium]|nr:cytochrome d ubiquinol oxidase subunit II [Nannocystaceae bacterium]